MPPAVLSSPRGFRETAELRPQRVFVRAPNWVGDLVMATAAFARIRAGFPAAHITCGLRPYLRSLLAGTDHFDDFVDTPRAGGLRGLLRQARELRRRRFDLAIVLPNSLETGLVARLAGVPLRVGYRQGRSFTINLGLRAQRGRWPWSRHGPRRIPEPMPTYYDRLLDLLPLPPRGTRTSLVVTDAERAECEAWFAARGVGAGDRVVALNAGASYGASKLWEPDRFAEVARRLREHGAVPVFLSGPGEVDMVRRIAAEAGALAAVDPVLPVGMLKPMVARSSLLITTDSGPRHVAVALDVPVVCLMGPNDPRYTNYGLARTALIRKDLECSPCQRKVCPLGHRRCMTMIEVDEVMEASERLLAAGVG